MDNKNQWLIEMLETLLSDGPEVVLGLIADNSPIHGGPIGHLWDENLDSYEGILLAATLAELGRDLEAVEVIELVAAYQWSRAAAA